jgi:lipopolysaccharide/colanic/teichoic acid biosynthesis glycosyltransferase
MLKRTFDFCCSFLGLILLFPLFVILLFLIKLEDPDLPVFFKQVRVGRGGEVFTMYKFRSMRQNPDFAHTFVTTADDPRITKIGVLIRRWKLDELPELYNVVIGDMSLVGPRPDVQEYADLLTGKYKCILYLRPGITGPASLKYSNEEYLLSTVKNPE